MTDPATLTDAELCEAVAREVIGWGDEKVWMQHGPQIHHWQALLLNWNGVGHVVKAMKERNMGLRLCMPDSYTDEGLGPFTKPVAVFYDSEKRTDPDRGTMRHVGHSTGYAENEDPARAVFEAALAAVRSVEP